MSHISVVNALNWGPSCPKSHGKSLHLLCVFGILTDGPPASKGQLFFSQDCWSYRVLPDVLAMLRVISAFPRRKAADWRSSRRCGAPALSECSIGSGIGMAEMNSSIQIPSFPIGIQVEVVLKSRERSLNTVDGRNPAPPGMAKTL